MIYSHEHKIVIYTPFKNYSSSIRAYFANNRAKFFPISGMTPNYNHPRGMKFSGHSSIVPSDISDTYTKYLPIRNPYDRVISQYWWTYNRYKKVDFEKWLYESSKQPVCMPVTLIYKDYDHLLRVEHLEEDMDKHNLLLVDPFTKENIPLPHKNKTENKFEMDISPEHEELIYFLHYEDFQAGGYKRLYK